MGQQRAFPIEHRDAVQMLVADIHPAPAVQGAGRGPDELTRRLAVCRKGSVVLAIDVAHGDAHTAGDVVQRTVGHIHPAICGNGGVGGIVETPALHGRHAQGHAVFQELDFRYVVNCGHDLLTHWPWRAQRGNFVGATVTATGTGLPRRYTPRNDVEMLRPLELVG